MRTTADKLKKGVPAVVVEVKGSGALRRRLYEMGCTPGASIYFIRTAPFGDPLEFSLRDYRIAVRAEDAATIVVEYDSKKWLQKQFV